MLEPAAGIGHFFGLMPDTMATHSRLTGVELDPISASITRRLYPDADLRNQAFEETTLVDRSFDLAISNVPFGDYKPFDAAFSRHNFLIHDYFFAKGKARSISRTRLCVITCRSTQIFSAQAAPAGRGRRRARWADAHDMQASSAYCTASPPDRLRAAGRRALSASQRAAKSSLRL